MMGGWMDEWMDDEWMNGFMMDDGQQMTGGWMDDEWIYDGRWMGR